MNIVGSDKPRKRTVESWEVEDALRTLTQARRIEKDKELMRLVKKLAAEKLAAASELDAAMNGRKKK
jgi:hypothetical protein